MQQKITLLARPALAGWLLFAFILAGCSGPGTVANTGADTGGANPVSSPATTNLTLEGSPPTSVTVGTPYSFQPEVLPSSAGVTFVITQKPAWASFNAATGALTGTPTSGNVGTTANIKITASDGSSSASIGPFEIAVDAPGAPPTGTATLTWVAPTMNTDGTILNNLAGYHIYYGTNADALTEEIDVTGATSTSYVINGLASGTYYFAITAYSDYGIESTDSNVATKTI
jgi:Putative Ig domain